MSRAAPGEMPTPPLARETPKRALSRLFSFTLLGQGAYAASQWACFALLARAFAAGRAEEEMGRFALALAVAGPIVLFFQMELRVLLATERVSGGAALGFRDYLRARHATVLPMLLVTALVAGALGLDDATLKILAWLTLARIVEGVLDLGYGAFARLERHDLIARSQLARAGLGTAAFAAILFLTRRTDLAVAGLAASWALVLLFCDAPSLRRLAPARATARVRVLAELLRAALPLALAGALSALATTLPRLVLESHHEVGELGIFGAVAALLALMPLLNQALRGATVQRLARHHHEGDTRAFSRLLVRLLLVASVPGLSALLLALLAGDAVLALLYSESFRGHADLLAWLGVAAIFAGLSGSLRGALSARRQLLSQGLVTGSGLLLTLACAMFFIPSHGALGAAWATVAGRALMALLHALALRFAAPARSPA